MKRRLTFKSEVLENAMLFALNIRIKNSRDDDRAKREYAIYLNLHGVLAFSVLFNENLAFS